MRAPRLCGITVRYVASVCGTCLYLTGEWTGNSLQFSGFSGVDKAVSAHREEAEKWKQEAAHVMS